jgi:hypothetical protein
MSEKKEWILDLGNDLRPLRAHHRRDAAPLPGVVESATDFEEGRPRAVADGVEGAALAGAIAAKGYKVVRYTSRLLEARRSGGEEIAGGGRGGVN